MSTTSTKQFKVYAEVGDIMGFEVKVINHERRLVIGDLDTGEGCVLPFGQLGKDRLDSLREPSGSDGGSEFNVRVLDAYTDSRSRRRILVSERAVEDRVFHQHVDHNTAESEVVPPTWCRLRFSPQLVRRRPSVIPFAVRSSATLLAAESGWTSASSSPFSHGRTRGRQPRISPQGRDGEGEVLGRHREQHHAHPQGRRVMRARLQPVRVVGESWLPEPVAVKL